MNIAHVSYFLFSICLLNAEKIQTDHTSSMN
jgi:hypothetical protein